MKKFKSLKLMFIALVTMLVMAGCTMPFGGDDKDDKDDDGVSIEVSTKKVTVDAGDEEVIEIDNYDDLKKLSFEVDDEDIATVEETDDGEYTVYGISEGKTEVTFSAKGCDDVTVKITVDAGDVELLTIEVSDYEVTVAEGEEYYMFINNYSDLEEVGYTVDLDDGLDVALVYDEGDGCYCIEGVMEGVTTLTFVAENGEDCIVDIIVEAAEDLYTWDGDYIVFGTYEQDGKSSNGAEPIEWEVVYEDKNGILLMSRYILDLVPFHDVDEDVTWETSYARDWCNDDFYYTAFTEEEREIIQEYYCENADNDYYGTDGGYDTYDYVFFLSLDEVMDNYDFCYWNDDEGYGYCQDLLAEGCDKVYDYDPEPHAIYIDQDEYDGYEYTNSEGEDATWEGYEAWGYDEDVIGLYPISWWLRTPGKDGTHWGFVWRDGETGPIDWAYTTCDYIGVRPCIYIEK